MRALADRIPAGGDLPEQQPIASETEPRLTEGGRPVLLKHKMANPGASVSGDGGADEQQWPSCR